MSPAEDGKSFMRLVEDENGDSYFVYIQAGEGMLHERCPPLPYMVTLSESNQIYSGVVTGRDLIQSLNNLKMEEEQYYGSINDALFTDDNKNYSFKVEKSAKDLRFKVALKKQVSGSDWMKVNLLVVTLRNEDADAFRDLFEEIIGNRKRHEQKLTELENECSKLRRFLEESKSALGLCSSAKAAWEQEMYGKFACVINEKKAEIRKYRENMMGLSERSSQVSTGVKMEDDDIGAGGSVSPKKAQADDDDDDSMYMVKVPRKKLGRQKGAAEPKDEPMDESVQVPRRKPGRRKGTTEPKDEPMDDSPPPVRRPPPKRKPRQPPPKVKTEKIGYDDDDDDDDKTDSLDEL